MGVNDDSQHSWERAIDIRFSNLDEKIEEVRDTLYDRKDGVCNQVEALKHKMASVEKVQTSQADWDFKMKIAIWGGIIAFIVSCLKDFVLIKGSVP